MPKKVTLYTNNSTSSILACKYLVDNDVKFEEINLTKTNKIKIASHRLPFLQVKGNGVHTVAGFDEFLYASALNTKLSYDKFMKQKKNLAAERQMRIID